MAKRYTDEQNKKWREGLPKKIVAAKVIAKSDRGNVLLVKPDYKDAWQLPGYYEEFWERYAAGTNNA